MKCISSPVLGDAQIVSFIEGEADATVAAHMAECPYCAEKADRWSRLQNNLKAKLYRRSCPTPMELGDYHLGLFSRPQALMVAQHIRECPLCRREVAELEEYLQDLAPQPDLLEPIRALIARLVSETVADEESDHLSFAPAFEGLRGDEDEPFIYQAGNVRVVIEVQDDIEQMGRKILLGLVTGSESNKFTIQVSQEGQNIATDSVDEIGNFVISHLIPGHYQLIFSSTNTEIQIQSLPVL